MLRRLSIVPLFMAVMMMSIVTVIPHHHHQTMICIVEEVCEMDGCCDDEHTHHSNANHEEDESHCVAHEKYAPSDNLVLKGAAFSGIVPDIFPILADLAEAGSVNTEVTHFAFGDPTPLVTPPPPLSLAAPNAPPSIA